MNFICIRIGNRFHVNGFGLSLALNQRIKIKNLEWMIKTTLLMLINTAYLHCREMAEVTNFTEDVLQKIKKELSCSPQYNPKVDNELKILSALNIFLSITAFLGNTLVLMALHRVTSLHPPSKLLYRKLAITDLCVGIIAEPLAVIYWISVVNESWKTCYYADLTGNFTGNILCAVTLCTLTVKSVNRLFILSLGIKYRKKKNDRGQIQRCCDFKKSKDNCNYHVGFVHCRRIKLLLESCYNVVVYVHRFIFVPCYSKLFLHEDFP